MKKENPRNILPKGFFEDESIPEISLEEALKDVTPVDWIYTLENWDENDEKLITLKKPREEIIKDLKEFYKK